ncbi:unnamed protein product [Haemonchus placei]|uniref:BAT2_N domain-containing protein n=1 Tax=Haemonchus placei TaxID=6290 RepID=A0A0N4X4D6_HAEPC|nr:unnamed protein product [Haemonchus placei]
MNFSSFSNTKEADEKVTQRIMVDNINWVFVNSSVKQHQAIHVNVAGRYGLTSVGKSIGVMRRMPPPATLPSLKSENNGQDQNVVVIMQGGAGWNKNETSTDPSEVIKPHSSCPTTALDLRPTWAKQSPSSTNNGNSGKGEFPTLSTSSQGISNTQKLQSMFSDFTNVSTHQQIAYFLDCFALIHQCLSLVLLTPITPITLVSSQISEYSDKRGGCWPPVDNAAQPALAFTSPLMSFALRHFVLNFEGLGIWGYGNKFSIAPNQALLAPRREVTLIRCEDSAVITLPALATNRVETCHLRMIMTVLKNRDSIKNIPFQKKVPISISTVLGVLFTRIINESNTFCG